MKVLLILIDGMRPDAIADIEAVKKLMKKSSYSLEARTVFPSVTLPCHMSLFHSVVPGRHGTTTNIYTPQVRPVNGICEQLKAAGKTSSMFYDWEELRDLSRPGMMKNTFFADLHCYGGKVSGEKVFENSKRHILSDEAADFNFTYSGWVDSAGHGSGWMSDEYLRAVNGSWDLIDELIDCLPEEYTVIITADHGGHDWIHGTEMPEDMLIPLFCFGKDFKPGKNMGDVSILDVAPTIAKLLGAAPAEEWQGKSLI